MALNLSEALLLFLDCETTGVDPEEAKIVELGACYFKGGKRLGPPLNIRIYPGELIPEEASKIHGIYDADVRTAPRFAEVIPKLEAHLSGAWAREHLGEKLPPILSGYNVQGYDGPLLNAELRRAGSGLRLDLEAMIDPIWCARRWGRAYSGKLTDLCRAFGVPLVNAHAAWADAEATGRLLHELVLGLWILDPLDLALEEQRAARLLDKADRDLWLWYLYLDHQTSELRVGFGKNRGRLLSDISPDDASWVAGLDGVPEDALRLYKARASGLSRFMRTGNRR